MRQSYFQQFYEWALHLIDEGKAYVCDLSADEARDYRGTLTSPGKNSPYRDRSIARESCPVRCDESRGVCRWVPGAARQD